MTKRDYCVAKAKLALTRAEASLADAAGTDKEALGYSADYVRQCEMDVEDARLDLAYVTEHGELP